MPRLADGPTPRFSHVFGKTPYDLMEIAIAAQNMDLYSLVASYRRSVDEKKGNDDVTKTVRRLWPRLHRRGSALA